MSTVTGGEVEHLADGDRWGIALTVAGLFDADAAQLQVTSVMRSTPDDFMVTEIDAVGVVVPHSHSEFVESGYHHPRALSATRQLDKPPVRIALSDLEQLQDAYGLSSATVQELRDLAASTVAAPSRVVIGVFSDKETRGCVRCSIKHSLPELKLDVASDLEPHTLVAVRDSDFDAQAAIVGYDRAAQIARFCTETNNSSPSHSGKAAMVSFPLHDLVVSHGEFEAKQLRKRLHECVTKQYPYLDLKYVDGTLYVSRTPRGGNGRKRNEDGSLLASVFTHAILHKRCVDAMDAKRRVAKALRVPIECVATAGTKDKRAVTWQRVSIAGDHLHLFRRNASETLIVFATADRAAFIELFGAELQTAPVRLGELRGNRFTLCLRNLSSACRDGGTADEAQREVIDVLHRRQETVRSHGFFNYFGPQRFGDGGTAANLPGLHVLRGDYTAALESIFMPLPSECPEAAAAKVHWAAHRDPFAVELRAIPRACRDLTEVIGQLQRRLKPQMPLDERVAKEVLMGLPFELRQMWMHAAQSYIFNVTASAIWSKRGPSLEPRVGDWVLPWDTHEEVSESPPTTQIADKRQFVRVTDENWASVRDWRCVAPMLGEGIALQGREGSSMDAEIAAVLAALEVPGTAFDESPLGIRLKGAVRPVLQRCLHIEVIQADSAAYRLCLALPSSSYATVVLREIFGAFPAHGSVDDEAGGEREGER